MDLQEALQVQENEMQAYSEKLAKLLENTIIAKSIFSHNKPNGGWNEIDAAVGKDNYFNPNFSIFGPAIAEKITDCDTKNFTGAVNLAVEKVNEKCRKEVFYTTPRPRGGVDVSWVK